MELKDAYQDKRMPGCHVASNCVLKDGIGKQPYAVHLLHCREVIASNPLALHKTARMENITAAHITQQMALRDDPI